MKKESLIFSILLSFFVLSSIAAGGYFMDKIWKYKSILKPVNDNQESQLEAEEDSQLSVQEFDKVIIFVEDYLDEYVKANETGDYNALQLYLADEALVAQQRENLYFGENSFKFKDYSLSLIQKIDNGLFLPEHQPGYRVNALLKAKKEDLKGKNFSLNIISENGRLKALTWFFNE